MRNWVFPLLFCLATIQAEARTWLVEKDGSGDFTVIQDCIDAAASGDSIYIGPGRFNEWRMYGGNTQYPARAIVEGKNLTLIGQGGGATILGPEEPLQGGSQHQGVVLTTNTSLVVRGLAFENLFGGVMSWTGGTCQVLNCTFVENVYAIYLQEGEGLVEDCELESSSSNSLQIFSNFQNRFELKGSSIRQVGNYDHPTMGVNIAGCPDAVVAGCNISGVRTGFQVDFGTSARVRDTQIKDIFQSAVYVGIQECSIRFSDCEISDSKLGFDSINPGSTLVAESTVFSNIETATLICNHLNEGYFRNCVLAKGSRGVVLYYPHWAANEDAPETVNTFDMRNNFWNTESPDSIQAWIEDHNDDESINYSVIWEPFHGEPVETESQNLGEIKALFR